jgi:hypothetical protein
MKIGFYSPHEGQMMNRMFIDPNAASGAGDDLFLPLVRLRQAALLMGVECATVDTHPIDAFDAYVCCDIPNTADVMLRTLRGTGKPCYALIFENHFLWSNNGDFARYKEFDRVFTYNDAVVDGQTVIKLNYAFDLPKSIAGLNAHKDKLAVMICSNHKRDVKHLVYADRRDTINWFQDHQPSAFDLYGLNWDKGVPLFQAQPNFQKLLRRIGMLRFFPRKRYASWRGKVARKRDVLGKYRFGFCYENTTEIPGYITEKIFDVMMAGTVPVYLGPENAKRHIPEACFVNRAEFTDHASLYEYLSTMTEERYSGYLRAIDAFLSKKSSYEFSIECFVERILGTLIK